jgi:TetR/AcrR family transcriptional regulator, regulator of cefoperazone and chloramphenicol sensitivity
VTSVGRRRPRKLTSDADEPQREQLNICTVTLHMRSADAADSIIRAALHIFGKCGIAATSLREVARVAEVSPALIVHHFGSKQGLIAAVDEAALLEFGAAYGSEETATGRGLLRQRAEETARVMREQPDVCTYLGRALVEATPGSSSLFQAMIEGGQKEVDLLMERGALRGDVDPLWATLQHFFLIWAPLSFLSLLERALGESLLSDGNLDRWVAANVELLEEGLYR